MPQLQLSVRTNRPTTVYVGINQVGQGRGTFQGRINAEAHFAQEGKVGAGTGVANDLVDARKSPFLPMLVANQGKLVIYLLDLLDLKRRVDIDQLLLHQLFHPDSQGSPGGQRIVRLSSVHLLDSSF